MKIALSGIVKNESKIIRRCLDACKDVVDYVAITDTGSNDKTPEIIEEWCKQNRVPCSVTRSKWVNFCHSRTEALRNSEKAFPDSDYLLLIDADMILENNGFGQEVKNSLTHDAYYLEQYNPGIKYSNVRLVSTKKQWYYVGVTHEYITCDNHTDIIHLSELRINDLGDGGSKSDKFTRDIKLLSDELKKKDLDPGLKSRYTFYLAQSYYDTRQYPKALRYYRERTKLGGYDMEVWYSIYKIGLCLRALDRWDEAETEFLRAYSIKPYRCEPLTEIVSYHLFRDKPNYSIAELYIYKLAKLRDLPNMDGLFNIAYYKEYYIDYLISIIGYYIDEKDMGLKSCLRILSSQAPNNIIESTKNNMKCYQD